MPINCPELHRIKRSESFTQMLKQFRQSYQIRRWNEMMECGKSKIIGFEHTTKLPSNINKPSEGNNIASLLELYCGSHYKV